MAKGFPRKGGKIYAIYGNHPAEMAKKLLDAAKVIDAIPRDARISLKPNLVVARPASSGATTHPEILAGIIEYLFDHDRKNVDIIEGSWVGDDTIRAFQVAGMAEVGKRFGVKLHDLKGDSATPVDTPGGRVLVSDRALAADFLISLPVLKGHCQTRMTCALKNMKGCITDAEKRRFHRDGLDECIAALAAAIIPHVSVVDGICGDLDFEEGGNPVTADRMLLGADPVKLDAYVCSLMGLSPLQVGYIPLAEKYGAGEMGIGAGDIVELNRPLAATVLPRASGKVQSLSRNIKADQACSACHANLIHALHRLGGRTGASPIHIGQGWQGKQLAGIGIGRCCQGAAKRVPGCPPSALDIIEALRT
ncbi:MAG: DUF362 domain-containing protein [Planctomycetota bacterium]|jgi:uncharacterized protein (DUF362 family)|nr:DUF362 domain-containing protein [Planctomycetota bacterium]